MRILISAGEASGDAHAASVMSAVYSINDTVSFAGIAGPLMCAQGCKKLVDMQKLNVMGVMDVLRSLHRISLVQAEILRWAEDNRPDVAILVDYPGFHMRMGKKLKAMGIPVVQYIAPKLWSWGAWRARTLKHSQDQLYSILPFEEEWFRNIGIEAQYVGNPSLISCQGGWDRESLAHQAKLISEKPIVALLPGSRPGEIRNHTDLFLEVGRRLRKRNSDIQFVLPRVSGLPDELMQPFINSGFSVIERNQEGYAIRVDAAVAVSGTATLELALWGTPTVLVYQASPFTIWLSRKLATVECAGLANIILGEKKAMPELIQEECKPEVVVDHVIDLLNSETARKKQQEAFSRLKEILGARNPSEIVAGNVLALTEKTQVSV